MANTNSVGIAKLVSNPIEHVKPNEMGGRVRRAYFQVDVVPVGAGDTMTLCRIPKGARVMGGSLAFSAAQGATATTAIGIAGATGKYRAAAITNATTPFVFAEDTTTGGLETTTDETIIATNAAAVWTTGVFKGHLDYVLD